jgi:hypothetical protein
MPLEVIGSSRSRQTASPTAALFIPSRADMNHAAVAHLWHGKRRRKVENERRRPELPDEAKTASAKIFCFKYISVETQFFLLSSFSKKCRSQQSGYSEVLE